MTCFHTLIISRISYVWQEDSEEPAKPIKCYILPINVTI